MSVIGVVDDDEEALGLVEELLKFEGHVVVSYAEALAALRAFETRPFDLVIADLRMPQIDGIELLRRLRQKSDVPVIFVTGSVDEVDELLGLRMGADDFIRKPFSLRVLVERVGAVLRRPRSGRATENVIVRDDLRIDMDRYVCTWKSKPVELTKTEFRLVESLAKRPGTVKSRDALVEIACGDDVGSRTIDSHMKRLRQKFRVADQGFDKIETLCGVGYRFRV
jgi:two-component system, OmpR family, response regulator ChvI